MRINLWEHKKIEDQTEHFAGLEFSKRMSALKRFEDARISANPSSL